MGEKDPGTPCHADYKLNTAEREQKIEIENRPKQRNHFLTPPMRVWSSSMASAASRMARVSAWALRTASCSSAVCVLLLVRGLVLIRLLILT